MKTKAVLTILFVMILGSVFTFKINCGGKNMTEANSAKANSNHRVLVAYFSRTGEQYGVGVISEGNTAILAKMIADKTGGDLFEIKVKKDEYPNTYNALVDYAKKEKQAKARPEIMGKVENMDNYDTVFIGYPNWWADMPMPVYTFLESYDFSNKNVYHFCTHEGSGGVKKDGFSLYGHIAQNERQEADKKLTEWLNKLNY